MRSLGKRAARKRLFDLLVVGTLYGEIQQVVVGDEPIEYIGREYQRRGYGYLNAREAPRQTLLVEKAARKGKSSCFSAQGTVADSQEE